MILSRFSKLVLAATLLVFAMGHGGGCCGGDEEVLGPPTGATCPPTSTLTYASFGQTFMTQYCTRCHSSTLSGDDRMGATLDHDFDTQLGIQQVGDHIDRSAGSGPDATNDQMPPDGARPTLMERQQLAEWMACGAP
ncbi:MAG TPA: c-type cytochrome [Kofleriaceae bacterium]